MSVVKKEMEMENMEMDLSRQFLLSLGWEINFFSVLIRDSTEGYCHSTRCVSHFLRVTGGREEI
jgi:hypothetical protein